MSLARDIADLGAVTSRLDTVGASSGALSNRNLIINGAMQVNQRGTQTVNTSTTAAYGLDRFRINAGGGPDNFVGTIAQDSDVPSGSGFSNSLKITTTTAESAIAAGEYFYLHQTIEAQNVQQLAYGTSSAKKVTLSFWVKSTITGTFAAGLYKPDSTSQIHNKTYTINDASTWEYKTITYEANTLSGGAIANDNGAGIEVAWHLAVGSNYKGTDTSSGWATYASATWGNGQGTDAVITTTNATFQITGVQLEVGDTATDFEHRTFGDELQRCSRYYQKTKAASDTNKLFGLVYIGADAGGVSYGTLAVPLVTTMRTVPSLETTGTLSNYALFVKNAATALNTFSVDTGVDDGTINGQFYLNAFATVSAGIGSCGAVRANGTADAYVALDAEL